MFCFQPVIVGTQTDVMDSLLGRPQDVAPHFSIAKIKSYAATYSVILLPFCLCLDYTFEKATILRTLYYYCIVFPFSSV